MTLSEFIESDVDRIVDDWEAFARMNVPAAKGLASEALRDHAKLMLLRIAADMRTNQNPAERLDKSRGERPSNAPALSQAAKDHAEQRFGEGFTLNQMVAEYRALRASVARHGAEVLGGTDRGALDEFVRFNEGMDQALAESIAWYSSRVEESRNLLLGVLGHDLRNPLGAVRNSATYLLRAEGLDGNQTKAAARIVLSSARMQRMIDDLLDFTRTRLGTALPMALGPMDMGEACRNVVDELRAFHPDRQLSLNCSGDLSGRWDGPRIGQLVSNMVANAIQHGQADTPVTVDVRGEGGAVVLEVHNSGLLTGSRAGGALFEPMMHAVAPEAERREGSSGLGLGLYIARQIAMAHGGKIEVASSDQDGTTFTVRLPRGVPPPN